MKVLVVDDDQNKIRQLKECVRQLLPMAAVLERPIFPEWAGSSAV